MFFFRLFNNFRICRIACPFCALLFAILFIGVSPLLGAQEIPKTAVDLPLQKPSAVIPKTLTTPPIDGKPVGEVWEKAVWLGNPVYISDRAMSGKIDTRIGLLWDDEALYVGFRVKGFRKPLTVTTTQGDDGLERDDSVEVTLKVPGFAQAGDEPIQFKLNAEGLRDDAIGFNFNWNAKWQGAVAQEGKNWSATFRIPFANFGVHPQAGDRWQANFGTFLVAYFYKAFLWSPVSLGHHHQGDFGTLVFGAADTPGSSISISGQRGSIEASGRLAVSGKARISLFRFADIPNFSSYTTPQQIETIKQLEKAPPQLVTVKTVEPDAQNSWACPFDNLTVGRYMLAVELLDSTGQLLQSDIKPLQVAPAIDAQVFRYPVMGSGALLVKLYEIGEGESGVKDLKISLMDSKGAPVREFVQPIITTDAAGQAKSLPIESVIELGQLQPSRKYRVAVVSRRADADVLASKNFDFQMPPRPSWAGHVPDISSGKVLAPYTPVQLRNRALSVWGRTYDWGNNILPTKLLSRSQPILSAPIQVSVRQTGQESIFAAADKPARFTVSKTGDVARFQAVSTNAAGSLHTSGSLEYDGFLTFDLDFKPKANITAFTLDIPLSKAIARFIQPLPGATNRDEAGAIPTGGIDFAEVKSFYSKNSIWVCNEKVGLFLEWDSLEGWRPPPGRIAQVIPHGADLLLRINVFQDEKGSSKVCHYRFRLQATPLRPKSPNWYRDGVCVANGLTWGQNVTALEKDVVRSLPAAPAMARPNGVLEIDLQNHTDLAAVTAMDYNHWGANENILSIGDSPGAKISLAFLKERNALTLTTPWGVLCKVGNAAWQPNGSHRIAITWGQALGFWVDGQLQGELPLRGLPLGQKAQIDLGSVSARYTLQGLRLRSGEAAPVFEPASRTRLVKTTDTVAWQDKPLDLQSRARTVISEAKAKGLKTLIFFEHWNQIQNGGRSKYEPLLKTIVADCHRAGLKVIFYFGFEIADVPENRDLIEESKALLGANASFYAPQQQNTFPIGYGGAYQEYLLYHMARLKKEIGIDGVYLDGTFSNVLSDNPGAGSGYNDANGDRVSTIPIDRLRHFAKQINALFVQDGGTVFAHLNLSPPMMGFVTNLYFGEHLGLTNTQWDNIHDVIPPDVSKTIYNSDNTGVPMVLCIQNMWPHLRNNIPGWFSASMMWADLYNTSLNILLENPLSPEGEAVVHRDRKLAEFGADSAQWIPYWDVQAEKLAIFSDEGLKMSVWKRADGAMVCALANDSDRPLEATAKLCNALKPKPKARASDFLKGGTIAFNSDMISISLPANSHRLILIQ